MTVDWLKIKTEYVTTKISYAKLSIKYGVSTSAIKRKAASEGWTVDRTKTEPKVYQKTVQKAVTKIAAETADKIASEQVTKDRVVQELAHIAFANGSDFAKVITKTLPPNAITGQGAVIQTVELVDTKDVPAEKRAAISGIKEGKFGIEVSTCDKVRALELLGKHLGLFDGKGAQQVGSDNNLLETIKAAEEDLDTDDLPEVE